MTPKPQQLNFFGKMLRRNDSVIAMPSASPPSSVAPSYAPLTQENDKLDQEIVRLQKRNEELSYQSELNQDPSQEISEALMVKHTELSYLRGINQELKECIRRNDNASDETIHTLELQLDDLVKQLEKARELVAKREAQVIKLENQQQQPSTEDGDEQQLRQQEPNDFIRIHWKTLQAKDKTIEFLRCRQAKSDKRIARLKEKVAVADNLGRDWLETIRLANSKVKMIEVKPQDSAGAGT